MKRTTRRRKEFLADATGEKVAVVLDLQSYKELLESAEELADIAAYHTAKPIVQKELEAGKFCTLPNLKREN